ncbi:hypothetical protein BGZ68_003143 [Mortierella alpina]|nr:hypothetical protein BGZ68_003143 [Mortierella alpina]
MASNTMNFGPEWMRRFPAKSSQPQTDLQARAPPPAAPPLQDWTQSAPAASAALPAFSYSSIAASNVRSQNGASGTASAQDSSATDGGAGGNGASGSSFATDSLNPFKYSKELMLSLYKPTGLPIEFERYEIMTSEESLKPMSSQPFSDQEQKLLAGNVNSEVARRAAQPGDAPQERTPGLRRESLSNNAEHSSGRYDRSDKSSTHQRNSDSRSHGVGGTRPRNLNNDSRSHSFRRTDPVEREREREREREPEDGLWNSPVSNLMGSFDANGVFRVAGEGDELEPLAALEETMPEPAMEETRGAASTIGDQLAANTTHGAPFQQSHAQEESTLLERHHQELYDNKDDLPQFSSAMNSSAPMRSTMLRDNDDDLPSFNSNLPSIAALAPASSAEPIFDPAVELSKWLYRDPSGSVQGPFLSEEMHEWYKGGFFSPDLLVKREQDQTFEPLGSLIRRVGSDDQPFLTAGVIHQELLPQHSVAGIRPSVPALAQNRQPLSQPSQPSGWMGMSAPTTPSTPSVGVDRLFLQQQQHQHQQQLQQQHSSGDLFSSNISLGPQRAAFGTTQDLPIASGAAGMPGLDSRWSTGPFGRNQTVESNAGWAGDAFSRGPMASMPAPNTPLGGPQYMEQQQRLHHQEIERQQYMQMLQRQSQMQAMLHQQQFMAAQQQFGNDPHALAALLAQQQAQQRQLQMRYQQLQFGALHGQDQPSTPGGTAIPWVRMGQPSSPWTTSIIPTGSDNYFDINKGDENQIPHSLQPRQEQPLFPQHAPSHVQQEQLQHPSQHAPSEDPMNTLQTGNEFNATGSDQQTPEQYNDHHDSGIADRMQSLDIHGNSAHIQDQAAVTKEVEHAPATAMPLAEDQKVAEKEQFVETAWDQGHGVSQDVQPHEAEETFSPQHADQVSWHDNHEEAASGDGIVLEAASWSSVEPSRPVKAAAPAPWAKPTNAEEESNSERRTPTLREIQEMEAKKAETAKAERQAQAASTAALSGQSNVADFTKGLAGSPAWSSAAPATPKMKTLKEIQQEEEAAMKRARAAAQKPHSTGSATGGASTGLAAIVASGGTGSIGKRYADTIGPRPTAVTATSGPWGSSAAGAGKPALVTRSSAVFSSIPSLNSPNSVSRGQDTSSWIEVGSSKRDSTHANTGNASHTVSRPSSMISHSATSQSANAGANSNEPRPVSEDFMRWCRQALKGLQPGVVLEDFIQMLLTFPLNPDPSTVELIQESIYSSSQSLNGRQFADEFIKRRKADAYPSGNASASASSSSTGNLPSSGNGASDSFKVVSKKGKKKGTA